MTWMPKIVDLGNGQKEIQIEANGLHRIFVTGGVVKTKDATGGEKPMPWDGWFHPSYTTAQKAALARCIASLFDGQILEPKPSVKSPLDYKLEIVQLEAQKKALALKIEAQRAELDKATAAETKGASFHF